MIKRTYQTILEARTPIAHHSDTLGNHQLLMRRKVRQRDGRFVEVPYITGDTMRHGLREAAAYAALDAAGLPAGNLSAAALNLLFAGGAITGASGPSTSIAAYREMVDAFPPLALLGGCAGNRCIPGKTEVGSADMVCAEIGHMIPGWVVEACGGHVCELDGECCIRAEGLSGHRAHVETHQRVRMDPSLSPEKRALLCDAARTGIEGRLLASEEASATGDARGIQDAKSSMMPRTFDAIAQGSLFFWEATVTAHTDLELDTWHVMIGQFLRDCRVGGKRATGFGRLRAMSGMTRGFDWQAPATGGEAIGTEIGSKAGAIFRAHMAERTDRLRAFLDGVVA